MCKAVEAPRVPTEAITPSVHPLTWPLRRVKSSLHPSGCWRLASSAAGGGGGATGVVDEEEEESAESRGIFNYISSFMPWTNRNQGNEGNEDDAFTFNDLGIFSNGCDWGDFIPCIIISCLIIDF